MCKYKPWIENSWKEKGYLLEDKQGGKTYMEDMDKIVTEVDLPQQNLEHFSSIPI